MKKGILFFGILLVLLVNVVSAEPQTIYVPDNYPTIQEAVDAANPGDTIIVRDGTYTENINVNKSNLTIKSENGPDSTTVQAEYWSTAIFQVRADYVEINGFTIRETNDDGISLLTANYCEISNNDILDNNYGILIWNSSNNNVMNNNVFNNYYLGVHLSTSSNNNIINNNVSENYEGIVLGTSLNNNINNNTISKNGYGIALATYSYDEIITQYNTITNNKFDNGIDLWIDFLWHQAQNEIYLNNFGGDTVAIYGKPIISWNSPERITYNYNNNTHTNYLGNYWDCYNGNDANWDGIGDSPHIIDYKGNDSYPLMEPFESYITSSQPSCSDGIKNGDETDIDCGGSCPACEDGKFCLNKADCLNNYCNPNRVCSIPSCYDGWKNGEETGIDCGGYCDPCIPPPSCSDGIQNGFEEGVDCGGICPNECDYELTILIIPVNWQGSYNHFKGTALAVSKYFLNRIPLKDCPNEYKALIPEEKDYDGGGVLWDGWKCYIQEYGELGCFSDGEFTLKIIEGCAKRYGAATGKKYDYVVGITDLEKVGSEPYVDFFGRLKCKHWAAGWTTWNSDVVISTIFDIKTVTHELGHQFGFSDQYCDCSGVIYEGINLGSYCGPNAPANPLNKELGCDYDGDCCWTTSRELYPGCYKQCKGNFDRFGIDTNGDDILDSGDRTVMSALVPRNHYDSTEYEYFKRIFQCPTTKTLNVYTQEAENALNLSSILELSLGISIDDNVTLNYINVTYGDPPIMPSMSGNYSLKILDENDIILYESDFNLNFFIFSNLSYFTNHTNLYHKIMYNTSMRKVQLLHNDILIFQQEINFCNFDNRCESPENHFSCPHDCESWTDDGMCNSEYDGVCDSDCLPMYDVDCMEIVNISLNQGWNLISTPLELTNNSINYVFNNTNQTIFSYKNNSFFVPEEIDNKLGYWIKLNESLNVTLIGTEIKNKNIKLDEGWNLIGYPSLEEKNVSKLFEDVNITGVFAYNGSWVSYVPNRSSNSLKEVRPSYGYWIYSNEDDLSLIVG